jgi:hypothetical protein
MKSILVLFSLLLLLVACTPVQLQPVLTPQNITLTQEDLSQLALTNNGTFCQEDVCYYYQDQTEVVLQLGKYDNFSDLNGSYQYNSLHLRGFQGLIEENTYGQLSRFYVNDESTTYYYHLWIVQDPFLIHITSKGVEEDKALIEDIGSLMMGKFG